MTEQPIVTIENGSLKGCVKKDYKGSLYYSFQGIPYAKPPIGDLRFKAPQPPEAWSGVRDATKEGSECFSKHMILRSCIGSEDCLFLNVYSPQTATDVLKPVMFWIHGGGFTMGSGNSEFYGPNYLLSEDVVLVTINYRLGLLGFLSFDDISLGISGNAGLKDQVMALQWVKKNIAKFGGDPNNVTIFGESAGGASVHYLVLSPLAKGLFHKAILQSGTALSLWAKGQKTSSAIATALGMESASEKAVFEAIKAMPVDKIFELQEKIPDPFTPSFTRIIGPVIENENAEAPFLTKHPLDIISSGKYNDVPMIIGFNSREGMLSEIDCKTKYGEVKFPENFDQSVPCDLNVPIETNLRRSLGEKIRNFYFASKEPSLEYIDQYYLLQGDIFFMYSIYRSVKYHSLTAKSPIYFYKMTVESKLNFYKRFGQITNPGVCHGDDVGYLFTNSLTTEHIPHSIEDNSVKIFIKLWTTFAKTGNPNPKKVDNFLDVEWKPVEPNKRPYLNIGDSLTVGFNPEQERMKFWDEMYDSVTKLL